VALNNLLDKRFQNVPNGEGFAVAKVDISDADGTTGFLFELFEILYDDRAVRGISIGSGMHRQG
jgi:hypothetical protein